MTSENKLKQIGPDRVVELDKSAQPSFLDTAATEALLFGLKTLSQRMIVALSNLFTLLTCASVFYLGYTVVQDPDSYKLVGLGLYAIFVLLLHLVKRK